MNRIPLLVGALIGVPLLVFLALAFGHDPNVVESPLLGKQAPDFVLSDFDGKALSSESLRGKPVVLNFWATWCQPCVYEHPHLVRAAKRYRGRVHFVGVVPPEDNGAAVDRFLKRLGSWGPTYHDQDGRVAIAYGVFKLPETYILDIDGRVREKVAGPVDPQDLANTLESLL